MSCGRMKGNAFVAHADQCRVGVLMATKGGYCSHQAPNRRGLRLPNQGTDLANHMIHITSGGADGLCRI